jgi:hypothetical protein
MPEYLSPEWFATATELVATASTEGRFGPSTADVHLVVEQTVRRSDDSVAVWHVVIDDGSVALVPGAAAGSGRHADLTFSCDIVTAVGVRDGTIGAQSAFIDGRLRLGGDITALLAHGEMFATLDDVLAPLR